LGEIKNPVLGEMKNPVLGEMKNPVLGETKNRVLGECIMPPSYIKIGTKASWENCLALIACYLFLTSSDGLTRKK
jgi:hypothetical protein